MWTKIKAFLESKTVKTVEIILILICSIGLIIGGIGAETIANIPALASGIVLAVIAFVQFIRDVVKKD